MREEPAEFDDGIMIASPTCSTYIDNPPEPLPYHRMARLTPRTRKWWRPLLVMLLAAGLIGAFFAVSLVVTVLFGVLPGMPEPTADMEDPRNPVDMFATLGMLAIGVPAVALAFRWAGGRRRETAGTLHSVVGRFRWSLMGRAALVVVPVFLVANVGGFFLLPPPDLSIPRGGLSLVLVYVVILAVTPLQCAAEEYVFRALPQQVLGTWLRLPVWGILLPVPLFVAGTGIPGSVRSILPSSLCARDCSCGRPVELSCRSWFTPPTTGRCSSWRRSAPARCNRGTPALSSCCSACRRWF